MDVINDGDEGDAMTFSALMAFLRDRFGSDCHIEVGEDADGQIVIHTGHRLQIGHDGEEFLVPMRDP